MRPDEPMLRNWRGRRYLACRAIGDLEQVIDHLGHDDGTQLPPEFGLPAAPTDLLRNEIKNAAAHLLRLVNIHNDGHVSIQTLRSF